MKLFSKVLGYALVFASGMVFMIMLQVNGFGGTEPSADLNPIFMFDNPFYVVAMIVLAGFAVFCFYISRFLPKGLKD